MDFKLVLAFFGFVSVVRITNALPIVAGSRAHSPAGYIYAADPDTDEGTVNEHRMGADEGITHDRRTDFYFGYAPADEGADTGAEEGALNVRALPAPGYINHPPEEAGSEASPDVLFHRSNPAYPKNDILDEDELSSESDIVAARD